MKKLLSVAVMCLCSFVLCAQKDVTTFLGIPVDGTKSEMIEKLKNKGFVSSSHDRDILEGEFNGEKVQISVVTNNDKVYRIAVFDENMRDETQIKIRFNTLCRQFQDNKKYTSTSNDDQTISEDEKIGFAMLLNNKQYEAVYYQLPVISKMDTAALVKDLGSMSKKYEEKYTEDSLANMTEEQRENVQKEMVNDFVKSKWVQSWVEACTKKCVWFKINKSYGKYYIMMFYDNEYNRANGEDL